MTNTQVFSEVITCSQKKSSTNSIEDFVEDLICKIYNDLFLLEPLVYKESYNNNGKSQDDVTELMTIL